jgi:hypothetical protein
MSALSREHLPPMAKAWADAVKAGRITWEEGNQFVDTIWNALAEHAVTKNERPLVTPEGNGEG